MSKYRYEAYVVLDTEESSVVADFTTLSDALEHCAEMNELMGQTDRYEVYRKQELVTG